MTEKLFPTWSCRVETPDGTMFVHILEDERSNPFQILINIGKAGTNLAAWADASARLASRLLPHVGVYGSIEELSGITSSQLRVLARGEIIRSGPEGIAYALLKYRSERFKDHRARVRPDAASVDP